MATGLYRYYAGLPPIARAIVVIALILIIIIIILWIRKILKDKKDKGEREQEFLQDYKEYCKNVSGSQTYPTTSYIGLADKIYQAGCSGLFCYATDEDAIVGVFDQLKTTCDAVLLAQAFGKRLTRDYVCFWGDCADAKLELSGWLSSELSASYLKEINDSLKSKNINFSI